MFAMFSLCWPLTSLCHVSNELGAILLMIPPLLQGLNWRLFRLQAGSGLALAAPSSHTFTGPTSGISGSGQLPDSLPEMLLQSNTTATKGVCKRQCSRRHFNTPVKKCPLIHSNKERKLFYNSNSQYYSRGADTLQHVKETAKPNMTFFQPLSFILMHRLNILSILLSPTSQTFA